MSAIPDQADAALSFLVGVLLRPPEDGGLSLGDRAALRRMDPLAASLPGALWRLLTHKTVIAFTSCATKPEQALGIVAQAVLEAGSPGGRAVGRALGSSRYAEQRLVRLVRARTLPAVAYEVRQAARWCSAQGVGVQFLDVNRRGGFGRYILAASLDRQDAASLDQKDAEQRARAIARDFFAAVHTDGEPATTET